jgi:hypothetical protein
MWSEKMSGLVCLEVDDRQAGCFVDRDNTAARRERERGREKDASTMQAVTSVATLKSSTNVCRPTCKCIWTHEREGHARVVAARPAAYTAFVGQTRTQAAAARAARDKREQCNTHFGCSVYRSLN